MPGMAGLIPGEEFPDSQARGLGERQRQTAGTGSQKEKVNTYTD